LPENAVLSRRSTSPLGNIKLIISYFKVYISFPVQLFIYQHYASAKENMKGKKKRRLLCASSNLKYFFTA